MPVEEPGDAAGERQRNEDRSEDDRHAHHRRGDLLHRREGRVLGREPLLDVAFDRLHHHDRVVDHQADGEHQPEQGQRVDGEAQERKENERPDQRHRYGEQRNQGGAPALQEEKDDQRDEQHGLEEGDEDLSDSLGHRRRGVQGDGVVEVGRKALLQLRHRRPDTVGDGDRVRAGRLEDAEDERRLSVVAPELVVGQRAELDAGDVAEPHRRTVRVEPHGDVAELLGGEEPPLGAHGIGELLAARSRLRAEAARGVHVVLRLDGGGEVRDGETELGQLVGLDPDAHRVIRGPPIEDLTHAGHAVERIRQVDGGVVSDEERVEAALRRVERDPQQWKTGGLLERETVARHVGRQGWLRLSHLVLRVHLVDGDVAVDVEGDLQDERAVVGVGGLHVEQLLDPGHLLLDRSRDRLLDGDGIGSRVDRAHLDLRRHDVRVLGHREADQRDGSHDHHQDGDDHRHDGTADEEAGHG